ncbi:MAG: M48 family metalloprotease [Fimbriimonadaceae bacterium]
MNNPFTNVFAGGVQRSYITLRSSIVDALDEDEEHLIGHELGHIKAGHVLAMSIAQSIIKIMELVGSPHFWAQRCCPDCIDYAFFGMVTASRVHG